MSSKLTNVLFYSNEVDAVSHVLTGTWSLPMIRDALMKGVVKNEGIYELNPGPCLTKFKEGLRKCGYDEGHENIVVLDPPDLNMIIRHKTPNKKHKWLMIEMPWGDIVMGGNIPERRITKQTWMKDWCDDHNKRNRS